MTDQTPEPTPAVEPEEVMTASDGCGLALADDDGGDCGTHVCIYVWEHEQRCKCLNCGLRFDGEIIEGTSGGSGLGNGRDILGRWLDEHGQPIGPAIGSDQ